MDVSLSRLIIRNIMHLIFIKLRLCFENMWVSSINFLLFDKNLLFWIGIKTDE